MIERGVPRRCHGDRIGSPECCFVIAQAPFEAVAAGRSCDRRVVLRQGFRRAVRDARCRTIRFGSARRGAAACGAFRTIQAGSLLANPAQLVCIRRRNGLCLGTFCTASFNSFPIPDAASRAGRHGDAPATRRLPVREPLGSPCIRGQPHLREDRKIPSPQRARSQSGVRSFRFGSTRMNARDRLGLRKKGCFRLLDRPGLPCLR